MKTLLLIYNIVFFVINLHGAASDLSGKEKSFYFINDSDQTLHLRIRTGGDTKYEKEIRVLTRELNDELCAEKRTTLENKLKLTRKQLAHKPAIRVILPQQISLIQNKEFFLLKPQNSFTFKYDPVNGGSLRFRAWAEDVHPTPDIDEKGQPTATSAENSETTLFASAPQVLPESVGFVLSHRSLASCLLTTSSINCAKNNFFLGQTNGDFNTIRLFLCALKGIHTDRYEFFETRAKAYSEIPTATHSDGRYSMFEG